MKDAAERDVMTTFLGVLKAKFAFYRMMLKLN